MSHQRCASWLAGEQARRGRRLGRGKPGADTADKRWHRFWHRVQPRRAPLPSFTARAVHLLHLSAAVGWVKLSTHGSEDGSEGRPAVALKVCTANIDKTVLLDIS